MTDRHVELVLGALLHDIGKVIYRTGEKKNHSHSGYDFLKNEIGLSEDERGKAILESVLYHHASFLRGAKIEDDSLAYITYIADNIASAADRRASDEPEPGFDKRIPLESIFNHLNGDGIIHYYEPQMLGEKNSKINYPSMERKEFSESLYSSIRKKIEDSLKGGMKWDEEYINSLIEILESCLTYVPSSTSKEESADISLFDHLKITAAISSCIYLYLESKEEKDYRNRLFKNAEDFYAEDAFLLYSIDISGIQSFIYTVTGKGALRMLRARSFYLEVFIENLIDEVFSKIGVSRSNLLYCGGGHMYALLPNTGSVRNELEAFERKTNIWLMDNFGTALYIASGYAACSANALKNEPEGSYKKIYQNTGQMIASKKINRYSASDILRLNSKKIEDETRECRICKNTSHVDEDGLCDMCAAMKNLSKDILYEDFFTVISNEEENSVPLLDGRWLKAESENQLRERIKEHPDTMVRAFSKNAFYSGEKISTKLWTGDYTMPGMAMEDFGDEAEGIDRIAVLRMDVDNLGKAFVSGFENPDNNNRYVTISRTATFSRHMTIFFKYYINKLLQVPECRKLSGDNTFNDNSRKVSIVYSGGDDVFLLGAWDDVVEASIDVRNAFVRYSQGKLTISGGIGLYRSRYPVHIMAVDTGKLEDCSKRGDKNAITIFESSKITESGEQGGRYAWSVFEKNVLGDKYQTLRNYFEKSDEHGKNFLYNLLHLIRNHGNKINYARYVYLLSRMEPSYDSGENKKNEYWNFSKKMYEWIKSDEDCRELISAIYLYAYYVRGREEKSK